MSATAATGRRCPKCAHVRDANERAPAWQCPACGIAYSKYAAWLGRTREAVTPQRGDRPALPALQDGSVWLLVGANLLTVVAAVVQDWDALSLMLLYWGQSVVIGVSNVFRLLKLEKFSTKGFRINDRPVDPTTSTKVQTAVFFAFHYGIFHAAYLVFLIGGSDSMDSLNIWFWVCMGMFAANHFWSFRYNIEVDRRGTPNIGTLMFVPYIRIVPMHMTIIFGAAFIGSAFTLILFGLLKTAADVAMHLVEHRQLQKVRARPGRAAD